VNIVIALCQRPLWEGDDEVVKRSVKDEPMWVAIHKCIETAIGISLYSYFYFKLAKIVYLSYHLIYFLFKENWRTRGQNRFCLEVGRGQEGGWTYNVYTYKYM
jgi:hypothetical protein